MLRINIMFHRLRACLHGGFRPRMKLIPGWVQLGVYTKCVERLHDSPVWNHSPGRVSIRSRRLSWNSSRDKKFHVNVWHIRPGMSALVFLWSWQIRRFCRNELAFHYAGSRHRDPGFFWEIRKDSLVTSGPSISPRCLCSPHNVATTRNRRGQPSQFFKRKLDTLAVCCPHVAQPMVSIVTRDMHVNAMSFQPGTKTSMLARP